MVSSGLWSGFWSCWPSALMSKQVEISAMPSGDEVGTGWSDQWSWHKLGFCWGSGYMAQSFKSRSKQVLSCKYCYGHSFSDHWKVAFLFLSIWKGKIKNTRNMKAKLLPDCYSSLNSCYLCSLHLTSLRPLHQDQMYQLPYVIHHDPC